MSARCRPGVVVGWSRSRGHSRFGDEFMEVVKWPIEFDIMGFFPFQNLCGTGFELMPRDACFATS